MQNDNINHPSHYNQGNIEVLDFIEDQKMNYVEGNIIKYVCRYRYKNGIEDLKEAQFYLNRLIDKSVPKLTNKELEFKEDEESYH